VIFVMCWEIYVLSEVERGQKRKKLGSVVVCRIVITMVDSLFHSGIKTHPFHKMRSFLFANSLILDHYQQ